ncbi:hypothetical protein QBC39DRAFT_330701 [Podospora conica]|nr:hypothetical protein QBC39DRAFT_330701 [Schizothecium conicum]
MHPPSHNHPLYLSNDAVKQAGYRSPRTPPGPYYSRSSFRGLLDCLDGGGSPRYTPEKTKADDPFVTAPVLPFPGPGPVVLRRPGVKAPSPPRGWQGPGPVVLQRPGMSAQAPGPGPSAPSAPAPAGPSIPGPAVPPCNQLFRNIFRKPCDGIPLLPSSGTITRAAPKAEEANTKLKTEADFAAYATRPKVDFSAPLMFPRRTGYHGRQTVDDERLANGHDDDDKQDPEECSTVRPKTRWCSPDPEGTRSPRDGYDSEAWRRHNRQLNSLRRANKKKGRASGVVSCGDAGLKRKEPEGGKEGSDGMEDVKKKRRKKTSPAVGDSLGYR